MFHKNFSDLAKLFDQVSGSTRTFDQIAYDSRQVKVPEKTLFLAMRGKTFDGHDFVQDLIARGVKQFILEKEMTLPKDCDQLVVDSTLRALQKIAKAHRLRYDYPVLAITGSNGKTIVKEWLYTVAQAKFRITKSPKSYNSQLGVALSLLDMSPNDQLGIFEAGISTTDEMAYLEKMIKPDLGIFTNIGQAHSEGFQSLSQKIQEKSILFCESQVIICCLDQEQVYTSLRKIYSNKLLSWTLHPEKEATINFSIQKSHCRFQYKGTTYNLKLPLTEKHQIENLLHVITASVALGLDKTQLQQGLDRIQPLSMRLSMKEGANNCHIIDDTYNNDISGLKVALDTLSQQKLHNRKSVILSDLHQTGMDSQDLYRMINELLVNHKVDQILGIGLDLLENREVFQLQGQFFKSTEEFFDNLPLLHDEMILIKGSREFHLERVVRHLEKKSQKTVMKISFSSILDNLHTYRALAKNSKIMVMVKALAYGTGSYEMANLLQYHHIDYLGVAYFDEGVALRERGIDTPIMVMNPDASQLPAMHAHGLEPEIYSLELLNFFLNSKCESPIHLKIETGMNRLGFQQGEFPQLLQLLRANSSVKVKSIFTHFASAERESDNAFTQKQASQFDRAFQEIAEAIGYRPIQHAVNSAGIVRWPSFHFDMVRLGIGLYGIDTSHQLQLKSPITLETSVSQIKKVKAGETIGYSRAGKVAKDTTIAIIPIGYADGYLRILGNGNGKVFVKNQLVPTIGHICMDMTMIDVSGIQVSVGDPVVLFGDFPTLQEVADRSHTIPYEILTNIGPRVKREYNWD